jgi:hypothetical protein
VTVAARISVRLREALDLLAGNLGLTVSRLGRAAVRLYLRYPPTSMADYELTRVAEKFPSNETRLLSVALSKGEAKGLYELASNLRKPSSQVLTLALANVLKEPRSTILEESYAMGTPRKPHPGEPYEKAVEAGIINSPKSDPESAETKADPDPSGKEDQGRVEKPNVGDPQNSLEPLAIIGAIIGIPVAMDALWLAANWIWTSFSEKKKATFSRC